jgi:YfiR/HmsC-like
MKRRYERNMQTTTLTPAKVMRARSLRGLLLLLGMVMLFLSRIVAQSPAAGEYQVKAAFLYNFAKFVEWPPSSFSDNAAPLRICVLGHDPFGQELRNIATEKTVNGRKLQVDDVVDLQLAKSCHILFIASSEKAQLKRIFESLEGSDVLTVGDTEGFAQRGGAINFLLDDNRVQFEVNHKAAEQAGLKVSSKLLNVAKFVIE